MTVAAGVRIGPLKVPPDNRTLGWDILGWTADYLEQPDGPNAGDPWHFTKEQTKFILNWYAIDGQGRFVYRYGMYRRMKGHGKDPLGAALACIELIGPCRFGGWNPDGSPIVVPLAAAWIQTAAVSKDQTRNTMTLFPGMFSRRAIEEFQIDLGKEIIYAEKGRKRIEAVTSSPRALEGGRPTFVLKNETHHWRAVDEGHAMAEVIRRNVAKIRDTPARALAISNAHAPGEDSDAEHDLEAYKLDPTGILYDCVEAPETDLKDDESLRAGLLAARGDSEWLNVDRLMAEIKDPRTSPAMARRFYLNQIVAEEDKPFDQVKFRELTKPAYLPEKDALIVLGFDGSETQDHTALIGTELATGHQWVVGYWDPMDTEGRIPKQEVDQAIDDAFERWNVWRMNVDPHKWGNWMSGWAGRWGDDRVVSYDTTTYKRMARTCLDYRLAIESGELTNDGDRRFVAAIGNSHKHMLTMLDDDGRPTWYIQKERPGSPLKIDAATAAVLSWQARNAAVAEGVLNETESAGFFV